MSSCTCMRRIRRRTVNSSRSPLLSTHCPCFTINARRDSFYSLAANGWTFAPCSVCRRLVFKCVRLHCSLLTIGFHGWIAFCLHTFYCFHWAVLHHCSLQCRGFSNTVYNSYLLSTFAQTNVMNDCTGNPHDITEPSSLRSTFLFLFAFALFIRFDKIWLQTDVVPHWLLQVMHWETSNMDWYKEFISGKLAFRGGSIREPCWRRCVAQCVFDTRWAKRPRTKNFCLCLLFSNHSISFVFMYEV